MKTYKKIRVLFTISNFNTAGSGKVIYDLVEGLDKSKFDVEIACGSDAGNFFEVIKSTGVKVHVFNTKTNYRPYYSLIFRILKISKFYKKQRYDIIHSWQWSNDWTEALAARFVGKKWIYTKKAMGYSSSHWKIKSQLANYIITVNDQMQQYFLHKKAQKLIPFGIDTDYYSLNNYRHNKENDSDLFNIITVANLVPVKKIEILIKAIHKLNDKRIKLTILGSNTNAYGQEMIALSNALKLNNQIDFLGKKSDIRSLYSQTDLYVITSEREGMPMALVEAMSMGVPVLGADSPGINYVLKDFKELLFLANNVDALAQKIKYMQSLKQIEREQIGAYLRHYCISHFTMTTFIDAHQKLYLELMS